jgi:pentose-5-phosphate-3-epimerase
MDTIDYRQQLLEEIESLSDRELEKVYKIVTFQANSKFDLEQVLTLIDQFGATEKLLIRRHLERDWAEQFAALMDRIQARVPPDISEEEVYDDVAEAIREVRAGYGDTAGA